MIRARLGVMMIVTFAITRVHAAWGQVVVAAAPCGDTVQVVCVCTCIGLSAFLSFLSSPVFGIIYPFAKHWFDGQWRGRVDGDQGGSMYSSGFGKIH